MVQMEQVVHLALQEQVALQELAELQVQVVLQGLAELQGQTVLQEQADMWFILLLWMPNLIKLLTGYNTLHQT